MSVMEIWQREWHHEPPLDGISFDLTVAIDEFKTGAVDCQVDTRLFRRELSDASPYPWLGRTMIEYSFAITGVLISGPVYQAIKNISELVIHLDQCRGEVYRLKNPRIKGTPNFNLERRLERRGKRAFDLVLVDFEFIIEQSSALYEVQEATA